MYLRRFSIRNIRSISELEMEFPLGHEAGWHVILGPNGSGKSTIVGSFALLMMGESDVQASRQDLNHWIGMGPSPSGQVHGRVFYDPTYDTIRQQDITTERLLAAALVLSRIETINLNLTGGKLQIVSINFGEFFSGKRVVDKYNSGWFSASFGPFRRFTGGDKNYDQLFATNRRLAPHLSALGEDVALTDALEWLPSLHVQRLQDDRDGQPSVATLTLNLVCEFLNGSQFLPQGAKIQNVTNKHVLVQDGHGAIIPLDRLSDGFRSALCLTIELIRQMFEIYGSETMTKAMSEQPGVIRAPGVVAIDEIDVHLHPSWQRDIGVWLTKHFPMVQFIVTTHSPIVCRAVVNETGEIRGSIWRLPTPGSDEKFRRIEGEELDALAYGDVLDAFGTELFGTHVTRSEAGFKKLGRLAELNRAALDRDLSAAEKTERKELRRIFGAEAGRLDPPVF